MTPKLEVTTPVCLTYDNIKFKTYYEIADTGNLSLLIVSGKVDEDALSEIWESIIKKDDEVKGINQYGKLFKNYQSYVKLQHTKIYVQTCLFKLYLERDDEVINELKKLGYVIDDARYYESIQDALKKSGHLTTRIISKEKEIERLSKETKERKKNVSFEQLIAELSVKIAPVIISEDITLARYNEYFKIAKRKSSNELTENKNGRTDRKK